MKNLILVSFICVLSLIGCSTSSTSSAKITPTFKSGTTRAQRMPSYESLLLEEYYDLFRAAGDIGHNTVAGLTSFQYYVTRIDLCNDLTISGSGYSNQTGCITVYGNASAENAYDTYKIADADADTGTNWIDIVAGKTITESNITAGTYNYGIIETRKPVKVNASVTVPNGSITLKTCTGGTVTSSGTGESLLQTVTVSNMTSCTKALTTFGSNGGGQWFKFQSPVTLEANSSYTLDLVANPASLIAGGVESVGGWGTEASYKDGTYVMLVPPISLVPVVRTSTQTTIREQYEIASMTGINGKIVLDLYFVGATTDVGTGSIVGAGTRFVNNSSATTLTKIWNPYSVTKNADGTYTFKDHSGNPIVSSLTRSTTTTAGGTQTVSVSQSTFSFGQTGSTTLSGTATFKGVVQL